MSCTSSYHDYELEWINGFAAKVHNSGRLQWIALLGDDFLDHDDYCRGIVVDNSWNIYVTGYSDFSWGTPINPHSVQYGDDAFVVKLTQQLEPEINVKYGSTELPDGSKIDFGIGSTENSKSTIFSVENGGDDNLILNGLPVIEITGADAGQFYVTKQPDASITPGGSTTFEITFAPTSSGEKTAKVAISSNDSDENPYDIHLTGVCDNPPRVNITSPEEGEAVYSQVDVKANATDDFGVEKVDFYIDGVLKKTDTSAPYSYLWNAGIESVGYHTLKARTFDTIGQTGEDRVTVRTNRIVMGIVARRNEDKAWIIKKEYGEIVLGFENPHFVPVFKFVIYRKVDGGDYLSIKEIPVSEIQTGSFIYLDKYLEKDKTYTYKAEAFNSAGKVIAVSGERTI